MVRRYLLTKAERAILKAYLRGDAVENQNYLGVIKVRLKGLDLDLARGDLELIARFQANP